MISTIILGKISSVPHGLDNKDFGNDHDLVL